MTGPNPGPPNPSRKTDLSSSWPTTSTTTTITHPQPANPPHITLNSLDVKKNENISKSKPKHKKRRKEDVSNIKRISPELLDALREVQRAYKKFKKLMKLERQKHPNQVFRCSFIK